MKVASSISVIALALFFTHCAAIIHGTSSMLHVRSEVEGAKIYVDQEYVGTQDIVVKVSKKRTPIFSAKKDGCTDGFQPAVRQFDAVTLLGILVDFGIISILVVDVAATGAVRKFEKTYIVNPHCPDNPTADPEPVEEAAPSRSGSGLLISRAGHVVTNWHVVEDAIDIAVVVLTDLGKSEFSATVAMADRNNDLAILRIDDERFDSPTSIPFGLRTEGAVLGERVFVMGYPLVDAMGTNVKVTDGIINSLTGYQDDPGSYQISTPVQPGNSGAPLFDLNGNLVGIVNAGITSADNVGYAVKASYLHNLLSLLPGSVALPSELHAKVELSDLVQEYEPYVVLVYAR